MSYKGALLFDLDGTLVDTAADFIKVLNEMRGDDGLEPLPEQKIRNTVSNGARALISLAYNMKEHESGFEAKRQELLDRYESTLGEASQLFEGFEQVIEHLENNHIAWGVVTNKPSRFSIPLLKQLNIKPTNDVIICPDHVTNTKPDPEPLYLALQKLNLDKKHCIYAGDHERDILAGKNANMKTVACEYGYIPPEEKLADWGADYIIKHPSEFINLCNKYFPS